MSRMRIFAVLAAVAMAAACTEYKTAYAGEAAPAQYKVLSPISHGNLTIFPVVASAAHDTGQFLTLDEGIRSGEVIVNEAGRIQPLIRGNHQVPVRRGGDEVNRLVLVNNSDRPLLLLAGEIVTGGKQDRVIGKDRIVPAKSDSIDLSVFCVEPGRWVEHSANFKTLEGNMAQPSVRAKAMGDKDQQKVWDEVRSAHESVAANVPAPARAALAGTSSYAVTMDNSEVKQRVEEIAAPIDRDYSSLIRQLRDRRAVGVVAAVNGRIIWADIFASSALLESYWPKLVRSYAAEAMIGRASHKDASIDSAQAFIDSLSGRHEVVESDPGVYRHTEVTGDGFKVFELTSLLPKTGFDVHIAKMEQ